MHKYATEQADLFKQTCKNPDRCRVDSQLATSIANQATKNKEILWQIVLAVEFLVKQSLAFRGHRDDRIDFSSYEINRGNFVALLQLLAKGNDYLQKHPLSSSRQARYTSKTIHNDVIHVYDGASIMSSGKEGVQAKIKETSPLALYTHCYAHCLNLSIAATCKLSGVRNLIGLINEAYLFLNNSPKWQQLFELTLKEYLPENSHSKLPGLCKTRWVERHTCRDVFLEMYELLVTFLDAVIFPHEYPHLKSSTGSWNWDKDTITTAQGLKASLLSFQTVVVFMTTKNILEVKALASKLQKQDQDIFEAYTMVDEVIGNIKSARKNIDIDFQVWYKEMLDLSEKLGIVEAIPRKTSIQRNRSNIPSSSPIDHYKKSVAIPLLDSLIM